MSYDFCFSSSKRKPENEAHLKHIMAVAERASEQLETIRYLKRTIFFNFDFSRLVCNFSLQ